MRQKVTIYESDVAIADGKIADIKIKHDAIINKSIELFDDDDPCIIHQSYVVKEYVDILLNIFKENDTKVVFVKDYLDKLDFLDYQDLTVIKIEMKG
jgi:hypothetical protein